MVQLSPFNSAQVFFAMLQAPLRQTVWAALTLQTPVCWPSTGMLAPFGASSTQANASRLQCCAAGQSTSAQQLPDEGGIQTPSVLHAPDWHAETVPLVHPDCPSAKPHLPLLPQRLPLHWLASAQSPPLEAAQVLVAPLQRPVAHAGAVIASQVPSCKPSEGSATPTTSRAVQVNVERLQYWAEVQSLSMKHPPPGAQTPELVHAPD